MIRRLPLLAVLLAAAAGPALAAPDIAGNWVLDQPPGAKPNLATAPLTPKARADADAAAKRTASGDLKSEAHVKCWPAGMPGLMAPPFGIQVLNARGRIVILAEISNLPRQIYMTQAAHPDDLMPSWNGHSIGRWEGDVLVVDTVGLNGRHVRTTEKTRITERFELLDGGKYLRDEITIEDPAIFTAPYKVSYRYRRLADEQEAMEYVCDVDPGEVLAYDARTRTQAAPP